MAIEPVSMSVSELVGGTQRFRDGSDPYPNAVTLTQADLEARQANGGGSCTCVAVSDSGYSTRVTNRCPLHNPFTGSESVAGQRMALGLSPFTGFISARGGPDYQQCCGDLSDPCTCAYSCNCYCSHCHCN